MPLGLRGANVPAVDAWAPAPRGLIAPFIVMDVVASANRLAAEGRDILHLEVGQPGASAPCQLSRQRARSSTTIVSAIPIASVFPR